MLFPGNLLPFPKIDYLCNRVRRHTIAGNFCEEPDVSEALIIDGVRTPIGKFGGGLQGGRNRLIAIRPDTGGLKLVLVRSVQYHDAPANTSNNITLQGQPGLCKVLRR